MSDAPRLLFHGGVFDVTILNGELGMPIRPWTDTLVREWALDPAAPRGLDDCAARRLVMPAWKGAAKRAKAEG